MRNSTVKPAWHHWSDTTMLQTPLALNEHRCEIESVVRLLRPGAVAH